MIIEYADGTLQVPPREEWPELGRYLSTPTGGVLAPAPDGHVSDGGSLLWYGCNANVIIPLLLLDEIIFISNAGNGNAGLFVNCNDVFAPAADSEPLPCPLGYVPRGRTEHPGDEALLDLYRRVKAHGSWGAMTWVALRRKEGPWRESVREHWIASGAYDPAIDTFRPERAP